MPRHKNKHVQAAVEEARAAGWRLEPCGPRAHCWVMLYCPAGERGGCVVPVYGTPRVPENEARRIRRRVAACPHAP